MRCQEITGITGVY